MQRGEGKQRLRKRGGGLRLWDQAGDRGGSGAHTSKGQAA